MATPILTQILNLINSGHSVAAAVEAVVPGADVATWERHIARYSTAPQSKPKAKRKSNKSRSGQSSRRFQQTVSVLSWTERQERERGQATVELVERTNDRTILVNLPAGVRLVA